MNEKSLMPAIRFAGFADAWERRKVEELATRVSSIGEQTGQPRVEYEDIISGMGQLNKDIFTKVSNKPGIEFSDGDVLYGKLRPYLKNWLLPNFNGLAVGDFWVLHPQNVDSKFLFRLIQSRKFEEVANQSVGTKMPRADWKLVSKTDFGTPLSLSEQRKVGSFFETLDTLITLHQRKHEKLLNIKKSMLDKIFPKDGELFPEVRFAGFTAAWERRKLGDMSSLITKGTTPLDKSNTGIVNFVKIENIDNETGNITITQRISQHEHESYLRRSQLKENDILFSIAGTLGRVTSVHSTILPANTNQALAIVRLKAGNLDYIKTFLKGKAVSDFVRKNPTIGAQPNLSLEQVANLEICSPNENEQEVIGTFFKKLNRLITLHQRKLQKLQNIKKACLEKMFV